MGADRQAEPVAVARRPAELFEDQQIERALQQLDAVLVAWQAHGYGQSIPMGRACLYPFTPSGGPVGESPSPGSFTIHCLTLPPGLRPPVVGCTLYRDRWHPGPVVRQLQRRGPRGSARNRPLPPGTGITTFFDRRNLTAGAPWFDELERALSAAPGALVIIGPSGLGRIQKRELQLALIRQAELEGTTQPRFRVVPVLLPPYAIDQIPGFAALNTWVEIGNPATPSELVAAIQSVPAGAGAPTPRTAACPFRALNSFREEDAPLYFGRTALSAALSSLVAAKPFVAVVGPSGSGKSSLVQAGLLPMLRAQRPPATIWEAIAFNPGKRPFYNVASALATLWAPDRGREWRASPKPRTSSAGCSTAARGWSATFTKRSGSCRTAAGCC